MESFLAFLGVSLIVIVTPGPDTAVTIRNTLVGGRSGGVATALGIACGQAIWAFATSIGVVTLLVASGPLFLAVKYKKTAIFGLPRSLTRPCRNAANRAKRDSWRPGRTSPCREATGLIASRKAWTPRYAR
jgi:LysE type translocator